ncbi:phosphatase PAP2 family protein, partial [Fulvivirga sp. RKSG066]|uniref:phosphatase PAP2 family protein n=1 Tax=Fulvivirga aurantia TaxID=2529383 RepID=UPI0012BCC17F
MLRVLRELINHKDEYFLYILFLIIAAILCGFSLNVFLEITWDLKAGELDNFDKDATAWIYAYRSESLTPFVIAITEMGSQWAYLVVIPIIAYLLYRKGKSWRRTLQATLILISTFFLNLGIKYIISRPRPIEAERLVEVHDGSFSYPSGHSMSAIAFYGFIIYLTFKYVSNVYLKWALITLQTLLILGIGTSRVYLGVHFPSDVVAGFVAGIIWLLICIAALKTINIYRQRMRQ